MKENAEQMRKRHQEEIDFLQNMCQHDKSHRVAFMWAPGHFGNDVEVCDYCGKILKYYDDRKF
jgi:hypothetical protein